MGYSRSVKSDIVIDIETLGEPVTPQDVEEYMAEYSPPKNIKDPVKLAAHRAKKKADAISDLYEKKCFSIDGKRMISCALGVVDAETLSVTDITSWASDDLSIITKGIVDYLDGYGEYRLIGWNCNEFDLPEVCKSFALTGKRPMRRPSKWDVIDLCKHPFNKKKLKTCAKAFGFEIPEVNGSNVAEMYTEGDWDSIKKYNEFDVKITGQMYIAACALYTF